MNSHEASKLSAEKVYEDPAIRFVGEYDPRPLANCICSMAEPTRKRWRQKRKASVRPSFHELIEIVLSSSSAESRGGTGGGPPGGGRYWSAV